MNASSPLNDYLAAKDALTCRMVAEPYNMHLVAPYLSDAMFLGDDRLACACRRLFEQRQAYSAFSVAREAGMDASEVSSMAMRHADTSLPEAFEVFWTAYGRYVESEVAQSVSGWLRMGMSAENIRIESDRLRKHKGILRGEEQPDGRADFEAELIKALRGEATHYPVRAPFAAMRSFIPHFEPGEYIIVAGRTGMGKSYFGLNCLYQCALDAVPAAYVNLENTPKDVQKRLWQMRSGLRFERDLSGLGEMDAKTAHDAWLWIKAAPVKVLNTGRSLQRIVQAVRQDYLERGTQLFVVDYVQLIRDGDGNRKRFDELGDISGTIRGLALELNVVFIGIAQVNREAERSANKRPNLSDLRGSGDLEQDASTVMLLYRPGYYEILTDEDGAPYPENYADIHVAKGRNCGTARIKCAFDSVSGFRDPGPVSSAFPATSMPRHEPAEDLPF